MKILMLVHHGYEWRIMKTANDIYNWYAGKRVLVTGCAGFVGSAIAERLHYHGAKVFATVRDVDPVRPFFSRDKWPRYIESVVAGDLTDYDVAQRAVAEAEPDVIFHLAAMSQVRHCARLPRLNFESNIMGAVNIMESVRTLGASSAIVIASSDKAYGEPVEYPVKDSTPFNPVHPYDAAKAAVDIVAQSYARYFKMRIGITRCGNIYGPGDVNWQRLIPGTLRDLLYHRRPILRSDGLSTRDYNYIEDIVEAYARVGVAYGQPYFFGPKIFAPGGTWIITSEMNYSVLDIVNMCRLAIPWGAEIEPEVHGTATDETKLLPLDGTKFTKDFEWYVRTDVQDGIDITVEWLMTYLGEGLSDD